jgi:hypothetical protein
MSNWKFDPEINGEGKVEDPPEIIEEDYDDAVEFDAKGSAGESLETAIEKDLPDPLPEPEPEVTKKEVTKQASATKADHVTYKIDPGALEDSPKAGFNQNAVQDALSDESEEGGVVKPKKQVDFGDSGGSVVFNKDHRSDSAVVMYGFSVTMPDNSVFEVDKEFNNIETAMSTINNNKYMMIVNNEPILVDIIDGEPRISVGDVEKKMYINGTWE